MDKLLRSRLDFVSEIPLKLFQNSRFESFWKQRQIGNKTMPAAVSSQTSQSIIKPQPFKNSRCVEEKVLSVSKILGEKCPHSLNFKRISNQSNIDQECTKALINKAVSSEDKARKQIFRSLSQPPDQTPNIENPRQKINLQQQNKYPYSSDSISSQTEKISVDKILEVSNLEDSMKKKNQERQKPVDEYVQKLEIENIQLKAKLLRLQQMLIPK